MFKFFLINWTSSTLHLKIKLQKDLKRKLFIFFSQYLCLIWDFPKIFQHYNSWSPRWFGMDKWLDLLNTLYPRYLIWYFQLSISKVLFVWRAFSFHSIIYMPNLLKYNRKLCSRFFLTSQFIHYNYAWICRTFHRKVMSF